MKSFTCAIFVPLIELLLSTTNTTFFGTLGRPGGAKKCTKYPFTIWGIKYRNGNMAKKGHTFAHVHTVREIKLISKIPFYLVQLNPTEVFCLLSRRSFTISRYNWFLCADEKSRQLTWTSPRLSSRFTSYLTMKSPSSLVPSQPGHFLCCSSVGENETCAWETERSTLIYCVNNLHPV